MPSIHGGCVAAWEEMRADAANRICGPVAIGLRVQVRVSPATVTMASEIAVAGLD